MFDMTVRTPTLPGPRPRIICALITVLFQTACQTPSETSGDRSVVPRVVHSETPPARLVFSTYLGGREFEHVRDVVTDAAGNIYLTGGTNSPDFPTTTGTFDQRHNGA